MVKNWFFSLFLTRVAQRCGQLLGCLWADLVEILGDEWARVWLWMIQILLGCDKVCGSSGWKTGKNRQFSPFLARVAQQCGQLLGCLRADLAEILSGERARVWLWMIQILLGCDKVCGSSSWKTGKNWQFSRFLAWVAQWCSRLLRSLLANLADILNGERVSYWQCKVRGSSGWKTSKNWLLSPFMFLAGPAVMLWLANRLNKLAHSRCIRPAVMLRLAASRDEFGCIFWKYSDHQTKLTLYSVVWFSLVVVWLLAISKFIPFLGRICNIHCW